MPYYCAWCGGPVEDRWIQWIWVMLHEDANGWQEWHRVATHYVCNEANTGCAMFDWTEPRWY